jgi:hypothetical protein
MSGSYGCAEETLDSALLMTDKGQLGPESDRPTSAWFSEMSSPEKLLVLLV